MGFDEMISLYLYGAVLNIKLLPCNNSAVVLLIEKDYLFLTISTKIKSSGFVTCYKGSFSYLESEILNILNIKVHKVWYFYTFDF